MHIHILGICGTFMAGVAAIAKVNGHHVTGCDKNVYPPMSTQLQQMEIELIEGYHAEQISLKPDIYVIGNVISRGNPLMETILNKNLPFQSGPEWMYENILKNKWVMAVAGTHGKTTTTAMLSWILECSGYNPGYLIGGLPNNFDTSAKDSKNSNFFVIEADEYDSAFFDKRSKFIHYHPRTLILNNLEFDHADIFDSLKDIERQFHHLIRTVPSEGKVLVNQECTNLKKLIDRGCWSEIEYFGSIKGWSYKSSGLESIEIFFQAERQGTLQWNLLGHHNVMNALASIAAAKHVGILPNQAIEALKKFRGVKRRMEKIAEINEVTFYDDFAHHPTAIKSTIDGLKKIVGPGRSIVALDPRSNTMKLGTLKSELKESLMDADQVYILASNDLKWDPKHYFYDCDKTFIFDDVDNMLDSLLKGSNKGDHVVFMSNGSFSGIQKKISELSQL